MTGTHHNWTIRDRTLRWGPAPLIMGILNVTPDSFSDGGQWGNPEIAVERAMAMVEAGAQIIDIGGESTRPGAEPVSATEEQHRIMPVLEALTGSNMGYALSVDTAKAKVAREAVAAGAHIINDVTALSGDPDMPDTAAASGAGIILMHMQGTPRTMQANPVYQDVVADIGQYLIDRMGTLEGRGISRDRMVLDPGIGFGKTIEHNLDLLRGLPDLRRLVSDRPVLIGASRKRFIGALLDREVDDRLAGSLAAAAFAVQRGAAILRVHDVKETCDYFRLMDTLNPSEGS